jgi:hypothetical protein
MTFCLVAKTLFSLIGNWSNFFRRSRRVSDVGRNVFRTLSLSSIWEWFALFRSLYFKFLVANKSLMFGARFEHCWKSWKIDFAISSLQIFDLAISVFQYFLTIPCRRPSFKTSFKPTLLWATLLSQGDNWMSRRFEKQKGRSEWKIATGGKQDPETK